MANYQWPWALPHQSLTGGLRPQPPKLRARTDMEDGTARVRRRGRAGPWTYPVRWPFTAAQYELFKGVWADPAALAEGAAWFDMPVLHGEAYKVAACRFVDEYQASLKGVTWTIDATLEVLGLNVLPRAEINDRWPGSIP